MVLIAQLVDTENVCGTVRLDPAQPTKHTKESGRQKVLVHFELEKCHWCVALWYAVTFYDLNLENA